MNFGGNQSYNRSDFGGPGLGQDDEQQQYAQMQGGYQQQMYGAPMGGQPAFMGGDMYAQQNQAQFNQYGGMGQQPMDMQNQFAQGGFQQQQAATPSTFNTGGFSVEKSDWSASTGAKEFIPKGKFVKTGEEFPDFDDLDDKPKKSKKKAPVETAAVEEEQVDESTPYKGKPSSFFVMNQDLSAATPSNPTGYTLNDDQWGFIFQYYPEYAADPTQMMCYLYQEAYNKEEAERIVNEQYSIQKKGGKKTGEDSPVEDPKPGKKPRQIGQNNKQKSKKDQAKAAEERKKAEAEKLAQKKANRKKELENEGDKAEKKIIKAFKDKDVDMNPADIKEVDTTREPCSIVFIGHVDAGKSTICGNLMYLMGVVDQRTIEKFKQEAKDKGRDSWWLAYVMDSSEEEKAKGKTVEMGRAQFDTPHKKFTVLDAPGHKNYVPNMIMGAALADVGALVISARKGEFEAGFEKDGQTREHAQLAKSLGVQKLVIIVNKMDCNQWDKKRFDEIQDGLRPFLYATGFSEDDLLWIPITGLSGQNINEPVSKDDCDWYKGPTLIQALDELKLDTRYPKGPLRIPILDKMKDQATLVVHGKVENGTVNLGDKLAIMPSGAPAQVLEVIDATNSPVKHAYPGDNVQLRINVADDDQIQRGFVLCHRDSMMPVTEIFEAEMDILELLEYRPIMAKGYTCIMHIHTFNDEIVIKDIVKSVEKNDRGEETVTDKPKFVRSNSKMVCRITPKNPIALEKLEVMPQMAKFTLRDEGKTIAIGRVLKYKPYTKGVVGQMAAKTASATKAVGAMAIVDKTGGKELTFNMETGEMKEKQNLGNIAEGDEDEDEKYEK